MSQEQELIQTTQKTFKYLFKINKIILGVIFKPVLNKLEEKNMEKQQLKASKVAIRVAEKLHKPGENPIKTFMMNNKETAKLDVLIPISQLKQFDKEAKKLGFPFAIDERIEGQKVNIILNESDSPLLTRVMNTLGIDTLKNEQTFDMTDIPLTKEDDKEIINIEELKNRIEKKETYKNPVFAKKEPVLEKLEKIKQRQTVERAKEKTKENPMEELAKAFMNAISKEKEKPKIK